VHEAKANDQAFKQRVRTVTPRTGVRGGSAQKTPVSTPGGRSGAFPSRAGLSARSVGPASAALAPLSPIRGAAFARGAALPAPRLPRAAGSWAGDECPVSLGGVSLAGRWQYPRGLIEPRAGRAHRRSAAAARARAVGSSRAVLGEPEDTIAAPLARVIAAGPRPQFEFEQPLPGGENPDAEDPILQALALRDRGERARARRLPEGLVEWDARCLDAHAHLGALVFGDDD
jgi:hypothetical protein